MSHRHHITMSDMKKILLVQHNKKICCSIYPCSLSGWKRCWWLPHRCRSMKFSIFFVRHRLKTLGAGAAFYCVIQKVLSSRTLLLTVIFFLFCCCFVSLYNHIYACLPPRNRRLRNASKPSRAVLIISILAFSVMWLEIVGKFSYYYCACNFVLIIILSSKFLTIAVSLYGHKLALKTRP